MRNVRIPRIARVSDSLGDARKTIKQGKAKTEQRVSEFDSYIMHAARHNATTVRAPFYRRRLREWATGCQCQDGEGMDIGDLRGSAKEHVILPGGGL